MACVEDAEGSGRIEILIVAPHGGVDLSAVGPLPGGATVTAVCWESQTSASEGVEPLPVPARTGFSALLRARILPLAKRNPIVRVMVKLSGFDEGRWFWLAASRTPAATIAARDARVIIAADRDAVYTAWRWGREARQEGREVAAVYGYPAGRAAIARAAQR